MNKKKYSFNEFLRIAFPDINPFKRKEFSLFHNLIKWFSIRVAYILFRLRISANTIDLFGLLILIPSYYFLYISIYERDLLIFIVSYLSIFLVVSIDFIDGVLAKAFNKKNPYGDLIDDLSPEIIRFMSVVVIGYISNNIFIFLIAILNAILQQTFIASTFQNVKNKGIILLLRSRYSLHSIRLLSCLLVPIFCLLYIIKIEHLNTLVFIYIIINLILNLIWIYLSLKDKKLK
mgnify:FL=1